MSVRDMYKESLLEPTDNPEDYDHATNCPIHQGKLQLETAQRKRFHSYLLENSRLDDFASDDDFKSLRGEVAVLRYCIEGILKQCETPEQILIFSGRLGDLTVKCEKLVSSCDRLDHRLGKYLSIEDANKLIDSILSILTNHIEPTALKTISNDLKNTLSQSFKPSLGDD